MYAIRSYYAPGTFQHSLQVANLAEEVIQVIGGNPRLVRAGALYHDVGKIEMPIYFIENQVTGFNPHSELTYEESAAIITSHVIRGIKKAKKSRIPDQIIDFIRTHHGTRKTEYFYQLQKRDYPDEEIDESVFTYHGPIPFNKETCVLVITSYSIHYTKLYENYKCKLYSICSQCIILETKPMEKAFFSQMECFLLAKPLKAFFRPISFRHLKMNSVITSYSIHYTKLYDSICFSLFW